MPVRAGIEPTTQVLLTQSSPALASPRLQCGDAFSLDSGNVTRTNNHNGHTTDE